MKYIQTLLLLLIILSSNYSSASEPLIHKQNKENFLTLNLNNFKIKQVRQNQNIEKFLSYRHNPHPIINKSFKSSIKNFGLNIHGQVFIFDQDHNSYTAARDAGMGGLGISFRYRPIPQFAFDSGIDFIFGTDYNGFDRQEIPFSVNGLIYFNTENKIQPYIVGGVNWSSATVHSDVPSPLLTANKDGHGYGAEYSYFGGQFGVGCDFKIKPNISLNFDLVSFLRGRTDINNEQKKYFSNQRAPEFINAITGQTANKSGGFLFRGGMTYWF